MKFHKSIWLAGAVLAARSAPTRRRSTDLPIPLRLSGNPLFYLAPARRCPGATTLYEGLGPCPQCIARPALPRDDASDVWTAELLGRALAPLSFPKSLQEKYRCDRIDPVDWRSSSGGMTIAAGRSAIPALRLLPGYPPNPVTATHPLELRPYTNGMTACPQRTAGIRRAARRFPDLRQPNYRR